VDRGTAAEEDRGMRSMKRVTTALVSGALFMGGCVVGPTYGVEEERESLRLVDVATAHLRAGRLDEARASFEVARELFPTAAATDGLGCVAFAEGDLERAEELFSQAYEMDRTYDNPLANLALVYEARGMERRAEELYREAIAAEPSNARARNNYAAFLESRGAPSERVLAELLRAAATGRHPIIESNLKKME
jgi:tetratricopeptide (TPR) repeat protein